VDAIGLDVAKAEADAAKWKRKYKDAMKSATEYEGQVNAILGMSEVPPAMAFPFVKSVSKRSVAVIVPATDWHVEETVSLEATNFKNEFSLSIAEERIGRYYSKILRLIDWQNHFAKVTELWHPLLGDLMSGYIHEELMETNSLSPTEAVVFLQSMLISGIDLLLKKTKLPVYIPTCVGNHGRTTFKKRIKTSCKNSYEWLLYATLAKHYASNERVRFRVGSGYHNTVEIRGRNVRFHHGDGLRYNGGVGGITIPVNKAVAQWDKVSTADFDIFGHYHTHLVNYPKWVSCGSLMGYSEYSVEIKAEYQAPTQTFIVIDRNYGMTCAIPIFVTKSAREQRNGK
jgi:hypothetical protein